MPLSVVVAGAEKTVSSASIIVAGVAKTVRRVEAWNGSAWKVVKNFTPAFSATISPTDVAGVRSVPGGGVIATDAATCSPIGGLGPFTYAWSLYGGDTASAVSPAFATSAFQALAFPAEVLFSQFSCLVTDSLGQTATAYVNASFSNTSTG